MSFKKDSSHIGFLAEVVSEFLIDQAGLGHLQNTAEIVKYGKEKTQMGKTAIFKYMKHCFLGNGIESFYMLPLSRIVINKWKLQEDFGTI